MNTEKQIPDWSMNTIPAQPSPRPHDAVILELLRKHGPLVPGQLMDMTGIHRSVIAKITRILFHQKKITHVTGKGWAVVK